VTTDRHKTKPKAVRMPGGLLAWYEQHAPTAGMTVNAAIVAALEHYRAANGGATAPAPEKDAVAPPERTRKAAGTKAAQTDTHPRCPHPGKRVIGGWCGDCDRMIEPGGYWREP
jgi:hypothetical protein